MVPQMAGNLCTAGDDEGTVLCLLQHCLLYGPRQANLVLIAYASSEGSGEPAHPRSLTRTFAARSYKQSARSYKQ